MNVAPSEDERALLRRLALLLDEEARSLSARDAGQLGAIAAERERVTASLVSAARERRAARTNDDAGDEAVLAVLYRQLRQRHAIQAQVVRRHVEANARAIGVLAQAAGPSNLYRADGRVALHYPAS